MQEILENVEIAASKKWHFTDPLWYWGSPSAKLNEIRRTSTTRDPQDLIQVEALLTRSLTNPVFTFPCWVRGGGKVLHPCVCFLSFFFWRQYIRSKLLGSLLWGTESTLTLCPAVELLSFLPTLGQHQEGFRCPRSQEGLLQVQAHTWRPAPCQRWWQMSWPVAGFKWGKLKPALRPLLGWATSWGLRCAAEQRR